MHDNPNGQVSQHANIYDTRVGIDLTGPEPSVQQLTVNLFSLMGVQAESRERGLTSGFTETERQKYVNAEEDARIAQQVSSRVHCRVAATSDGYLVELSGDGDQVPFAGAELRVDGNWRPLDLDLERHLESDVDPVLGRFWTTRLWPRVAESDSPTRCRGTLSTGLILADIETLSEPNM